MHESQLEAFEGEGTRGFVELGSEQRGQVWHATSHDADANLDDAKRPSAKRGFSMQRMTYEVITMGTRFQTTSDD